MPGIYGTPSPFAFSFHSLKVEQLAKGTLSKKIINNFLIIRNYNVSIFAAQYLNSGILPKGSKAELVSRLAAASL